MATRAKDLFKILLRELESKKTIPAKYDSFCSLCDGHIEEGEDFIFMGASEKVCTDCQQELIEMLELEIAKR